MGKRTWHSGTGLAISSLLLLLFGGCQSQPELKSQSHGTPSAASSASTLPRREAIFFLKGDASLSPGAIVKLKTWVETWGVSGKWTLHCPSGPGLPYELLEKRLLAIRAELRKLGLAKVGTVLLPSEPAGQYDAIYVVKEPS